MPEDENDLAYFLRNLPADIPVTVVGAGSNLIVRDGGVPGVVIRLGRGFNAVTVETDASPPRRRRRCSMPWWRAKRKRPASPGWLSSAAFPARSAARCA